MAKTHQQLAAPKNQECVTATASPEIATAPTASLRLDPRGRDGL